MTGHHHDHGHDVSAPPALVRRMNIALIPFGIATLLALILLWPSSDPLDGELGASAPGERYRATVVDVTEGACAGGGQPSESFRCMTVTARLDEGQDEGDETQFEFAGGEGTRRFGEGDGILLSRPPSDQVAPGAPEYFFVDYQRSKPLLLLALLFAAVVVALSRWRGLAAIAGLAISILVLTRFMLPAILEGRNPLLVAIVGSAVIMFAALYMSHGFTVTTTTAVLGTLASLAITGVLALVFVEFAKFTGLASEEATFLQVSADQINLQGLLLGGIIIGALGVLDDVTVTQASAVWALRAANPTFGPRELYRSALRIGRDHIASTVNTLVLAYAGASLPLLVLFTLSESSVANVLTSEVIAEELVRTLVGSIGLVASVPITTALAASVAGARPTMENPIEGSEQDVEPAPKGWKAPRAEREWRQDP